MEYKLKLETITGSEKYQTASHAYYMLGDLPVLYVGQYRQNAHNSRESALQWRDQFLPSVTIDLPDRIEVTAEQLQRVAHSRYRQTMTREREQAQEVIQSVIDLAGSWHPISLIAVLVSKLTANYDPRCKDQTLADPWKYKHIYRAITDLVVEGRY